MTANSDNRLEIYPESGFTDSIIMTSYCLKLKGVCVMDVNVINFVKENIQAKEKEIEAKIVKYNKEDTRHNLIVLLVAVAVIAVYAAISVVLFNVVDGFWDRYADLYVLFTVAAAFVLVFACIANTEDEMWGWDDFKCPSIDYMKAIANQHVLLIEVGSNDNGPRVQLTLEDPETHEVTTKYVFGWKKKICTDVDIVTVDVGKETIYFPYIRQAFSNTEEKGGTQ